MAKVLVVGGGAAGLLAAGTAAKQSDRLVHEESHHDYISFKLKCNH